MPRPSSTSASRPRRLLRAAILLGLGWLAGPATIVKEIGKIQEQTATCASSISLGFLLTRTSARSTFSAVSTVVTFSPSLNHSRIVAASPAEMVAI